MAALLAMIAPALAMAETAAACSHPPPALAGFEASASAEAPEEPVTFVRDGDREEALSGHRGRGVVVNFWATWCAPCVKEMPALDALNAELAEAGIDVLALSSDFGGAEIVRKFYDTNEITHLPVLMDPRSAAAQSLGVVRLPTTVLFDPQGQEVGRVVGAAEWDAPAVAEFLRACLAPTA